MKTSLKLIYVLTLSLIFNFLSCNNDDDIDYSITITETTFSIDENPSDGDSIGILQAESDDTLSFSITTQSANGALAIDAATGELTVADARFFNYEVYATIEATITVSNSVETETIALTINISDVVELEAQDTVLAIDENPSNGDVLGSVQVSSSNPVGYSINSQSPAGAIAIDANSGEITVANSALFDFEINPTITATIALTSLGEMQTVSATINLNDIDNIKALLSTSQASYNSASNGEWVIITEAEYNNIAANLMAITRAATTEVEYANPVYSAISPSNNPITVANSTTNLVPANGYLIAFKYKVWNSTNVTGVKLKLSSSGNNVGFSDFANPLPTHSGNNQDVFFVLKNNNTPVNANSYLGFFQSNSGIALYEDTSTSGAYWNIPDSSDLIVNYTNWNIFYQGLSTTQMQW